MSATGIPPLSLRTAWWRPFVAGAATGLLAGILLRARGGRDAPPAGGGAGEGWSRLRDAWDDAAEGLAAARDRVRPRPILDEHGLGERVAGLACAARCRVRVLGEGIVELVGRCSSDDELRVLLDALAAEPGVEVVVNRVWTPASAGDGAGGDADRAEGDPPH